MIRLDRRLAVIGGVMSLAGLGAGRARAQSLDPVRIGITPVVIDSDVAFLDRFSTYFSERLGRPVIIEQRRTYQEITALLLSGQIEAAWICGYPYVQHRDRLQLIAVPIYRGEPLYQSYMIVAADNPAQSLEGLRDQIHAFSDPDSNSGFLVTRWLLHQIHESPRSFFSSFFFTYGHRNVVRAVAADLAQSGSVDGYVWEILQQIEPSLTGATRVLHRSQKLGFPPIACLAARAEEPAIVRLKRLLLDMDGDASGRALLASLHLDRFDEQPDSLFAGIASLYEAVRSDA
ncbi:PhnD/SsuA/transferrin family substrate-binding protein [Inquilinus sp. Marseille-Q2685]|uniref:PhnD/SsuA/transferrin family substrate-binding protein n=1 Tax=Inquilinus sp. Marseille-Q2685 TaxID=2866581 RepID=UPI001CE46C39|nr:PhnD/SsuA/transferrin family substrate-binding protein [Inquilinus sp. Marseille-Q2685]